MVAPDGGGGKADVAGLWIEFVLIPQRLEEHLDGLASGRALSPGHAELVNMFLEQAVANHKLSRKEPDPQGGAAAAPAPSRAAKTASLLCERAVRVASAARFSLEDIEVLVPRHLQSLLLRASVKYDKDRSLFHECNFHRWVIHKALAPEALRLSMASPAVRARDAATGEPAEIFQDGLLPVSGESEQEGPSVRFLEDVLASVGDKVDKVDRTKKKVGKAVPNGVVMDGLQEDGLCQILFDVAESHFMRGRIKKAHDLFSKCASLADGYESSPVPEDRLHGFIVACRAVASSGAVQHQTERDEVEAVLICERSRVSSKRKNQTVLSDHCNGVNEESPHKKVDHRVKQNGISFESGQDHTKQVSNGYRAKLGQDAVEDKGLVKVLADDVLAHRLPWEYCLSLEKDFTLPASVRCKVAACNILRRVIEGASFDSLQRFSEQFQDNKEAVQFLMQLVSNVSSEVRDSGGDEDLQLLPRLQQFTVYFCCTLEESWCWKLACKKKLVSPEFMSDSKEGETVSPPDKGEAVKSGLILLDILQGGNLASVEHATSPTFEMSAESIAKAVQLRAFDALDRGKDYNLARQLYDLAKRIYPEAIDSELFLWFVDRTGGGGDSLGVALPERAEGYLSSDAVVYIVVRIADEERWSLVLELCSWAQRRQFMDHKDVASVFREAAILGVLMPMCLGQTHAREDEILRKFEELMTLSFSTKDGCLLPGMKVLPVVSKLSSVRVLEVVENLLAGWINRWHAAPPVELARYGALARMASAAADSKSQALRTSGDWGEMFHSLLQRLLELSKGARHDSRGSRWLLGLADLAFVDHAYLSSLQFYLEAGAVRSSFYCDRVASMAREFFTPWVITRMIAACKEIGAQLQAAILCQCLPDPDYESAFQILQANPLIVDQDAALYFDCVWEIPILELLVHMHAKAGDRARVNTLISLLQQPALNVHNPASIRQAHIAAMEQRFLQRLYAELV
ncbi:uncharacterized protein LOC9634489 isoform X1 [Selaginella moellendorffii]|uniref:uncharacterized protein LOC9634489 isoform X1 n=1 Tax=Selaginella moellendorffii TaxID=88036 RepID=UPI000D1C7A89|nr:uncharacterized protein LOC9634489 isoform X1 [Selaginella moellendorffii]XP_024540294.1 uncharacterized protein LOC9634489 isoform X1 [Selaginella moellendorffii]XP_024540295.1 uncharacterized protein LOC9634489 isoform X1 [Selaginella moellendorffii]|eukprot:XP_024540293.1 uncharacterized protein LOC9634489 isoform X1 [Selaginella moellendorffii]